MGSAPSALAFVLMIFAGWVNRHQLIVIEFLQTENRLLKERLRGKRIRFTDAERALLARKAKAVGRKALLKLHQCIKQRVDETRVCVRYCGDSGVGWTHSEPPTVVAR